MFRALATSEILKHGIAYDSKTTPTSSPEMALVHLSNLIEKNPDTATAYAYAWRAMVHEYIGQHPFRNANKDHEKGIALDIDLYISTNKEINGFLAEYQYKTMVEWPWHIINRLIIWRGIAYNKTGDYHNALKTLDLLLEENGNLLSRSTTAQAYNLRGQAFLGLGQTELAKQDFLIACDSDRDYC